jgi:phosphopentomutase
MVYLRRPTVLTLVIDAVGLRTLEFLLDNYHGTVNMPNLVNMGLIELVGSKHRLRLIRNDYLDTKTDFAYALEQASTFADSVTGHREIVGIVNPSNYDLFFDGFPKEYITKLEQKIGRKTIFNQMCPGLEALTLNREEHEKTGFPIVYASKCDPIIQIGMNENVIPVKEAHAIADIAFDLAIEMGINITRSIARTYIVKDGEIIRTNNRHDRVLPLEKECFIDIANQNGVYTVSVGKPAELIPTESWDKKVKLTSPEQIDSSLGLRFVHPLRKDNNPYSIQGTINELKIAQDESRLGGTYIFTNCVDTDSLYGHTQDIVGSLRSIEEIDRCLPLIKSHMSEGDILLITADHGMRYTKDYGYHNKEPVPLLGCRIGESMNQFKVRNQKTFASVSDIAAQAFGLSEEYRAKSNLR